MRSICRSQPTFELGERCTVQDSELVIGIMITGKDKHRKFLAKRAIDSFFNQTHASKLLFVVNDSPDYSVDTHDYGCLIEKRVALQDGKKPTLGQLRNIGLDVVPDDHIWVQWDDDDWRARSYISLQHSALIRAGTNVMVLKRQIRFALTKNASYHHNPGMIEGTIMMRSKANLSFVRYPSAGKSEDSGFIYKLDDYTKISKWDNPAWMYFRLFHGANTWDANHYLLGGLSPNRWCQRGAPCSPIESKLHHVVWENYAGYEST
eukprot:TRINITY_DN12228_c1_g16_i2.p1 TRINITY_DN12228_c1_g16~~TRINITY_DN12228_c1_g16_i2.p1  ORF type:complete len:263 (+),score=28.12 TRINITY_DN12228_c1_g16_i2:101-889(+)